MKRFGNTWRMACPVCDCKEIKRVWDIPFSRLPEPTILAGANLHNFPCLDSETVWAFAQCDKCCSIFLHSLNAQQGHQGEHYIKKMEHPRHWAGYERRYEIFKNYIPENAQSILEAAAGIGQYLTVTRDHNDFPWERFCGIEYNGAYVKEMHRLGFEAYSCDLNLGLPLEIVGEKFDAVIFSEAFEHMFDAGKTLGFLVDALRPGGMIFWSAQAIGSGLPIRPEETIYLSERGLEKLCEKLNLGVRYAEIHAGRYLVAATKLEVRDNVERMAGEVS